MQAIEQKISFARWIRASFIGWFIGILLILALAIGFDSIGIEHLQFFMGIGMGIGVGYMQWKVLKKAIGIEKNWVWTSIVGLGAPMLLLDLLKMFSNLSLGNYHLPLSIGLGGICIGLLQHKILAAHSSKSGQWIPGCALGWTAAIALVWGVDYTKHISSHNLTLFFLNIALILGGGIVLGLITGGFLRRILS